MLISNQKCLTPNVVKSSGPCKMRKSTVSSQGENSGNIWKASGTPFSTHQVLSTFQSFSSYGCYYISREVRHKILGLLILRPGFCPCSVQGQKVSEQFFRLVCLTDQYKQQNAFFTIVIDKVVQYTPDSGRGGNLMGSVSPQLSSSSFVTSSDPQGATNTGGPLLDTQEVGLVRGPKGLMDN